MTKNSISKCTSASLAAADQVVVSGEHQPDFQERVSFGDLDLRKGRDRQVLRQRVWQASERVCQKAEGDYPGITFFGGNATTALDCIDLTYMAARPRIQTASALARSGQP